jgi:small-conductance mechanosensitive channel
VHVVAASLYVSREALIFVSFLVHFTYYRFQHARKKAGASFFSVLRETLTFVLVMVVVLEMYNLYRFVEGLVVGLLSYLTFFQVHIHPHSHFPRGRYPPMGPVNRC